MINNSLKNNIITPSLMIKVIFCKCTRTFAIFKQVESMFHGHKTIYTFLNPFMKTFISSPIGQWLSQLNIMFILLITLWTIKPTIDLHITNNLQHKNKFAPCAKFQFVYGACHPQFYMDGQSICCIFFLDMNIKFVCSIKKHVFRHSKIIFQHLSLNLVMTKLENHIVLLGST
jgi:hypothetical protein